MQAGAITQQIDVAQLAFIVFFIFFLGLVYHLRREDKREGYPLDEPGPQLHKESFIGFPIAPPVQRLHLLDGGTTELPHYYEPPPIEARYLDYFGGAPLVPVGNPLLSGLGPSTWVMRDDKPFRLTDGQLQVVPIRTDHEWSVREGEVDPHGMPVFDARWRQVGTVVDLWVDRSVKILRYFEVQLGGMANSDRRVLLPIYYADVKMRSRRIHVAALRYWQFAEIPALGNPEIITAREEDQVNAYFAGGQFHAGAAIEMVQP